MLPRNHLHYWFGFAELNHALPAPKIRKKGEGEGLRTFKLIFGGVNPNIFRKKGEIGGAATATTEGSNLSLHIGMTVLQGLNPLTTPANRING